MNTYANTPIVSLTVGLLLCIALCLLTAAFYRIIRAVKPNAAYRSAIACRFVSTVSLIISSALNLPLAYFVTDYFDGEGLASLLMQIYMVALILLLVSLSTPLFLFAFPGIEKGITVFTVLTILVTLLGIQGTLLTISSAPIFGIIAGGAKAVSAATGICYAKIIMNHTPPEKEE